MVPTYSHERRLNAIKALVLLAVIVALILAPRLVRAELLNMVQRFEGDSRVETSVAISRNLINEPQSRRYMVLATAGTFADAQTATPLAVRAGTSILMTPTQFLHPQVKDELQRALTPGATVYIAGGEQALSPRVAADITQMGFVVERLHGPTRVETAIAVANKVTDFSHQGTTPVKQIFAVRGDAFAPGLVTSSRAARDGGLMVIGDAGIAWAKATLPGVPIAVIGEAWSHASEVTTIPLGDVRTLVDRLPGMRGQTIALANVHAFPDALSGGVHAATTNRDLYLITNTPDRALGEWLRDRYTVDTVTVYGGQAALPDHAVHTLMD